MIVVIDCIEHYRKYRIDIPVELKVRIQMIALKSVEPSCSPQ